MITKFQPVDRVRGMGNSPSKLAGDGQFDILIFCHKGGYGDVSKPLIPYDWLDKHPWLWTERCQRFDLYPFVFIEKYIFFNID